MSSVFWTYMHHHVFYGASAINTWTGRPCQFFKTSLLLLILPGQNNILRHNLWFVSTFNVIWRAESLAGKRLDRELGLSRVCKQCGVHCGDALHCCVWSLHMHMHGRPDGMAFCKRGVAWPEDSTVVEKYKYKERWHSQRIVPWPSGLVEKYDFNPRQKILAMNKVNTV